MAVKTIQEQYVDFGGNYYFRTQGEEPQYYIIRPFFKRWCVYFNVVDDIEELVFTGDFGQCVAELLFRGAVNYDPMEKFKNRG